MPFTWALERVATPLSAATTTTPPAKTGAVASMRAQRERTVRVFVRMVAFLRR